MVADALDPNKHQAINNHPVDTTMNPSASMI